MVVVGAVGRTPPEAAVGHSRRAGETGTGTGREAARRRAVAEEGRRRTAGIDRAADILEAAVAVDSILPAGVVVLWQYRGWVRSRSATTTKSAARGEEPGQGRGKERLLTTIWRIAGIRHLGLVLAGKARYRIFTASSPTMARIWKKSCRSREATSAGQRRIKSAAASGGRERGSFPSSAPHATKKLEKREKRCSNEQLIG